MVPSLEGGGYVMRSPADTVLGYWDAWGRRDRLAALAFCSDTITYARHIPQDVLPTGGFRDGKAAVSDTMQMIIEQFESRLYHGVLLHSDETSARGRVDFHVRHRVTGHELEASMRMFVRDGLLVTVDELHDIERIRAYMSLIAYAASEDPDRSPTET
jgi:ketosteroid isomerase-like protein